MKMLMKKDKVRVNGDAYKVYSDRDVPVNLAYVTAACEIKNYDLRHPWLKFEEYTVHEKIKYVVVTRRNGGECKAKVLTWDNYQVDARRRRKRFRTNLKLMFLRK